MQKRKFQNLFEAHALLIDKNEPTTKFKYFYESKIGKNGKIKQILQYIDSCLVYHDMEVWWNGDFFTKFHF